MLEKIENLGRASAVARRQYDLGGVKSLSIWERYNLAISKFFEVLEKIEIPSRGFPLARRQFDLGGVEYQSTEYVQV